MAVRSQNVMYLHESLSRHDECGRLVVRDAKSSRTSLAVGSEPSICTAPFMMRCECHVSLYSMYVCPGAARCIGLARRASAAAGTASQEAELVRKNNLLS